MNERPKPVAVTTVEGGRWYRFSEWPERNPLLIHAITFDDGTQWDTVNGWRGGQVNLDDLQIVEIKRITKNGAMV